jgi:hypothetical protein
MSTEDGNYDLSGDGSSSNSFNYGNGQFILDPNSKEYEFVTNDPGVITYTDPVTGVVTASGGSGVGATGGGGGGTNWSSLAKSLLGKAATPAGIASLATGLYGAMGGNKPSTPPGWRGVINPNALTATRTQLEQPEYKPYSGEAMMGRKRFSDTTYGPTPTINPAITPIAAPAVLEAAAPPPPPPPPPPLEQGNSGFDGGGGMAAGGVAGLAHGGRYLKGATDGMADKLDTDIDGKQAAKLSHGEFVIPADVVSHLGNGNSEAGANVLYKMMDRVRQARTGNPKQGKEIKPEKFMPGGLAALPAYADGGAVAFVAGGTALPPLPTAQESNLSSWAGPGIADYITKGTAIAQQPYQAYQGPLSAGYSPLQTQAFNTAGDIKVPTASMGAYKPGTFDAAAAKQYMNPYLQASLDPQLAEARRQSQITQMGNNAQAVKAGAFGGSRGALMNTETQRNLGSNLANITGQGYNTAYNNAQNQFNTEVGQQQTAQNQTNQYGLQALSNQLGMGTAQRGIESEGIAADKAQFEEERNYPMAGILATQKLYQGLPVSTVNSSTATTGMQNAGQIGSQMQSVYDVIGKMGL